MHHEWDKQLREWMAREILHWYGETEVRKGVMHVACMAPFAIDQAHGLSPESMIGLLNDFRNSTTSSFSAGVSISGWPASVPR